MKADAQRIAIAEACGWTRQDLADIRDADAFGTAEVDNYPPVPDYLNSLDAMHEAEKELDSERKRMTYSSKLGTIMDRDTPEHEMTFEWSATAAQRAEAFLKTLNLWTP